MPALRAAFEQRGVPHCWSASGNEADDLAATLAVKVTQAGHQATIAWLDKGFHHQLLSPTFVFADYFQKRWLDAPFIDKGGVQPQQLPDYCGACGDQQFKGTRVLRRIGPKSATQLLVEFRKSGRDI